MTDSVASFVAASLLRCRVAALVRRCVASLLRCAARSGTRTYLLLLASMLNQSCWHLRHAIIPRRQFFRRTHPGRHPNLQRCPPQCPSPQQHNPHGRPLACLDIHTSTSTVGWPLLRLDQALRTYICNGTTPGTGTDRNTAACRARTPGTTSAPMLPPDNVAIFRTREHPCRDKRQWPQFGSDHCHRDSGCDDRSSRRDPCDHPW